jgi:hypothetical protein
MLDRLIAFSLLAHAVQAAILVADTRGWFDRAACPALGRWHLKLARRLEAWRSACRRS